MRLHWLCLGVGIDGFTGRKKRAKVVPPVLGYVGLNGAD